MLLVVILNIWDYKQQVIYE